jgi:hypothetical protein
LPLSLSFSSSVTSGKKPGVIEYLKVIGLAFGLTVAVEGVVALLFGLRQKFQFLAVFLINLVTNPLMNYVLSLDYYFNFFPGTWFLLVILEIAVILIEWWIILKSLRLNIKRSLFLSVIMNLSSCIAGLIVFY